MEHIDGRGGRLDKELLAVLSLILCVAFDSLLRGDQPAFNGALFVALTQTKFMEPRKQLALMDKIIRELDDLKNSQTSVLKKIAQIEADNINLNIELLADALPDIHQEVDDGLEKVSALLDQFTETRNNYEHDNQAALAEPTE